MSGGGGGRCCAGGGVLHTDTHTHTHARTCDQPPSRWTPYPSTRSFVQVRSSDSLPPNLWISYLWVRVRAG